MLYKQTVFLIVVVCALFSPLSQAQYYDEYWEIAVFAGERTSDSIDNDEDLEEGEDAVEIDFLNDSSVGLILGWNFDYNRTGELMFSHSNTKFDGDINVDDMDVSISYLHIGGTVTFTEDKVPVFLSGGLGIAHIEPEDKTLDSETRPSVNIGIGVKFLFSDKFSMRLDARGYGTFFNSDGYLFCNGSNGCIIKTSSNLWLQGEFTAGFTYRF